MVCGLMPAMISVISGSNSKLCWQQAAGVLAEEYAIHDYKGFGGYALSEYVGVETAHEIACFVAEYPDFGGELLNHFGGDLEETKTAAEENYCGCYQSLDDYAQELTEETTQIHENVTCYVDYERMGRDMEMGGDIFTLETGFETVHVFWSR